jgi:hypothetical protein
MTLQPYGCPLRGPLRATGFLFLVAVWLAGSTPCRGQVPASVEQAVQIAMNTAVLVLLPVNGRGYRPLTGTYLHRSGNAATVFAIIPEDETNRFLNLLDRRDAKVVFTKSETDRVSLDATVVVHDRDRGWILLRAKGDGLPPPPRVYESEKGLEGRQFVVASFPPKLLFSGDSPAPNLQRGQIIGTETPKKGGNKSPIINCGLLPGSTGGPVIDEQGRLVALADKTVPHSATTSCTFPLSDIYQFVCKQGVNLRFGTAQQRDGRWYVPCRAYLPVPAEVRYSLRLGIVVRQSTYTGAKIPDQELDGTTWVAGTLDRGEFAFYLPVQPPADDQRQYHLRVGVGRPGHRAFVVGPLSLSVTYQIPFPASSPWLTPLKEEP